MYIFYIDFELTCICISICFCVDFNEEVEDLTQDIFNLSLKDEEPFSQRSTSPERNDVLGVPPLQQII